MSANSYDAISVIAFFLSLVAAWWAGYCAGRRGQEEAIERAATDRDLAVLDHCLALWDKEPK